MKDDIIPIQKLVRDMALTKDSLSAAAAAANASPGPLVVPWPMPGNLGGCLSFATFAEWQNFVLRLGLRDAIPLIVAAKFEHAQKLYLLAWVDFDLIKAGELVALTTLELALLDRYGGKVRDRRGKADAKSATKKAMGKSEPIRFADLLKYMPAHDGLTDDKLPMIRRSGGSVVGLLTGDRNPTLAQIWNDLAHGYPFDGIPLAGLLELVRDLIEYAYRDMIPGHISDYGLSR